MFLALVTSSIGVVVSATAKDPIVTATINLNGWTSDAGDGNSIYWYKVPQDDSIPVFNSTTTSNGTYNLIFSNVVITPATLSSSIAAAQQIGFAFVNQTAAHSPGWNDCNQYGGCTGSTHIFRPAALSSMGRACTTRGTIWGAGPTTWTTMTASTILTARARVPRRAWS